MKEEYKMAKESLIQSERQCYICRTEIGLHLHHIYGGPNRSISDNDGCYVYLCQKHHTGPAGVHFNPKIDQTLKERCEMAWLQYYSKNIDDFIARYGKNYL